MPIMERPRGLVNDAAPSLDGECVSSQGIGELPRAAGEASAIVSTGLDGTFIHSRDGPIEVKLGV